jgi:hypothetical protein
MAEICTGHFLCTNPSVTAPRTCSINCLWCASSLFLKLFLLQHAFHSLSIAWSNTKYLNLPYGFYKFRSTPSCYQVKRDVEGHCDHYHKKAYNSDKPMTIDNTITLSFFRQSIHAPNNGSMLMLIFGLSRCHFDKRLLQCLYCPQKPLNTLHLPCPAVNNISMCTMVFCALIFVVQNQVF